ncbi:hypothetical protein [Streptomyces sp. NPDC088847]|uniref:hypothetical protein n=1 Tax=Streptomyces sp. NPDC088847 TaxID=3365909 RepID=UPI00380B3861
MTPGERWIQRVMGGLGVRPVGHSDPRDEDDTNVAAAPAFPMQAPAPGWPPAGARRVPSGPGPGRLPAPGRTIDLGEDEDEGNESPEAPVEDNVQDEKDPVEDDVQDDEEQKQPAVPPTPTGPIAKVPAGARPVRKMLRPGGGAQSAKDDPSLRITVFNLSAAGVGFMTPLAGIVNKYLVVAEQAAQGIFALVLALAGGAGAWWLTRHPAVHKILPYTFVSRPLIIAGAAEVGRRMAPIPVAWLNENGQEWGLGPSAVSLLITSGGICALLWWLIDRKLRPFHWVVRWLFRIPLATAVVCTLLNGNPIH